MSRPTPMIGTTAGWKQRKANADAARETAAADRADPLRQAIRVARAEHVGLATVRNAASREAERIHGPIYAPAGARGLLHPSRVRRIEALMAAEGWSADPTDAVEALPTREEIEAQMTAEARERVAAAEAALAAFEEGHETIEPVVVAEPARRGPGRPPKVRAIDISALGDE